MATSRTYVVIKRDEVEGGSGAEEEAGRPVFEGGRLVTCSSSRAEGEFPHLHL